jgi:hypothetical protein
MLIITWGMNNRPVGGRSSETQSHATDMNNSSRLTEPNTISLPANVYWYLLHRLSEQSKRGKRLSTSPVSSLLSYAFIYPQHTLFLPLISYSKHFNLPSLYSVTKLK